MPIVDSLDIFVTKSDWGKLLEVLSQMLGMPGLDKSDESGRRHEWYMFSLEIVAMDQLDFVDDNGIPFSTFPAMVGLYIGSRDSLEESEAFLHAFGVQLLRRVRSRFDPMARLIRNMFEEIEVGE